MSSETPEPPPIDRRRYRRVRRFFAGVFLHLFWHDVVLRWPILRWLRSDPLPRWTRLASRYRSLAVELGGVLIKLGQFLSTRVDILPLEIVRELSGLQDEVPAAPVEAIIEQIESDLGHPLGELFPHFDREPLGAASLAQVHAARLANGREVVVKVLRPGIETLVETDLGAIGQAIRWAKAWKVVRRRIDLDWVEEEFATTTRRELDLENEGRNAETFAELFEGDPDVYLPSIYWPTSGRRTLTEENVAFLKITDFAAIRAAGIDPAEVARRLYRVYMRQIFEHNLVHADPHPGNLFVKPLATEERGEGPGFQIVFVDFGMVAEIPPRLRAALRRFVIGLGNRDAGEVIQAFRDAGYLLPGADLVQLEEAVDALFERFWGVEMGRMGKLAVSEVGTLWNDFGQLLLETPIQLQVDLMFTGRAVEILGGLTTELDEGFNPWDEVVPFADALARQAADRPWQAVATELVDQLRQLAGWPANMARVANLAQRGRLTLRTALAPDTRKQLQRIERRIGGLSDALLAAAALVAGAVLYAELPLVGLGLMGVGAAWGVLTRWLG